MVLTMMTRRLLRLSYFKLVRGSGLSAIATNLSPAKNLIEASDEETEKLIERDVLVFENFITEAEEQSLFKEVEPYLKRLRYEYDHWDDAIHGYRETERTHWNPNNKVIIQRVRELAFPPGTPQLGSVHVLDLAKSGHIKPHVDSIRFCGSTIAGLSLLSDSVMRFQHEKNPHSFASVLLSRRSLYIMRDSVRYDYTHEILGESSSVHMGKVVPRDRRISVICRCEPAEMPEQ